MHRWRDLRLPVKLTLVMVVPMIVMATLGVALIGGQLANAGQYARASRLTELSTSVRAAIVALQDERQQAGGGGAATHAATDTALAATRSAIATDTASGDLDPVASAAWSAADRQLSELSILRAETSTPSPDRAAMVSAYSQLVDALFAFDRVLVAGLADAQLTRPALALYDLSAAREEVRYQQSVVLAGIARHVLPVADVTSLHGSEARMASRISDFRAVASPGVLTDYTQAVTGPTLAQQNALLGQAISESGGMGALPMPGMAIDIPVPTWNAANQAVIAGLTSVTGRIADALSATATNLRATAAATAGTAIAVLLVALAATIALTVLVARQLLRSIGLLRRTARDVAARQLPDAVERIRAGESVDVTVAPVGVHTADEVGQLARAFDAVHSEALRLAVEQANLRANYSELFVNLSRRSQSLVQRQLRLIEQLERDEEDPDQLSALFKLDHLATRMRRNNENLMVLSGSDPPRGPAQPVTLADLLRAGVSEIEQYQRVVLQPPPDALVVGYAASDLVRLLAELLDNATAFSAPETPVTVASHRTRRRAVVIDIVDHGIGMNDEDLIRANEQLGQPAGVEGRISRRMGLFVVSRLANQHGIRVRLHGGQDIPGLRVTVTVPVELVVSEP
ncbi:MAG TPA: nitrate- and nitrite sensing domain-containing protein, partial [Pseudonocardiaceae bacterium]